MVGVPLNAFTLFVRSVCVLGLAVACSSSATNDKSGAGGGGGSGGGTGGGAAGSGASGDSGPPAEIICGSVKCNALEEKCCFVTNETNVVTTACMTGTCPGSGTSCDDRSDCEAQGAPGSHCCASLKQVCADQAGEACITNAQCALPVNCTGQISCDPTAEDSCPNGKACNPAAGKLREGVCDP